VLLFGAVQFMQPIYFAPQNAGVGKAQVEFSAMKTNPGLQAEHIK